MSFFSEGVIFIGALLKKKKLYRSRQLRVSVCENLCLFCLGYDTASRRLGFFTSLAQMNVIYSQKKKKNVVFITSVGQ
jgi:hypothetical protein